MRAVPAYSFRIPAETSASVLRVDESVAHAANGVQVAGGVAELPAVSSLRGFEMGSPDESGSPSRPRV